MPYTTELMRPILVAFCGSTHCAVCPLKSPVCRCGCGTFFNLFKDDCTEYSMTPKEVTDAFFIVRQAMEEGKITRWEEFFR